jgi:hypothetical protein
VFSSLTFDAHQREFPAAQQLHAGFLTMWTQEDFVRHGKDVPTMVTKGTDRCRFNVETGTLKGRIPAQHFKTECESLRHHRSQGPHLDFYHRYVLETMSVPFLQNKVKKILSYGQFVHNSFLLFLKMVVSQRRQT